MIWNIVFFAVFWAIGSFVFSIFGMQLILIITVTIPMTKKIVPLCQNMVDTIGILKSASLTILLNIIFMSIIFWGVNLIPNSMALYGLLFGMGQNLLISGRGWGLNESNISDYVRNHRKYYSEKDLIDLELIKED